MNNEKFQKHIDNVKQALDGDFSDLRYDLYEMIVQARMSFEIIVKNSCCTWTNKKDKYFNSWYTDCKHTKLSTRVNAEPFIPYYDFCPFCGGKIFYKL